MGSMHLGPNTRVSLMLNDFSKKSIFLLEGYRDKKSVEV